MLIYAPISVGELLDKISILELKLDEIYNTEQQKNIEHEHQLLIKIKNKLSFTEQVYELTHQLKEINQNIWRIENQKRSCEANKIFDDKFVSLSRELYFYNDKRGQIKKEINKLTGSEVVEEKKYTQYE